MPLRPGELAALAARCLPLLPSGPGGVHRATLRETRPSTQHEPSGAHVTRASGGPPPKDYINRRSRTLLSDPRPDSRSPCARGGGDWRRGRDSNPGWSFPHTRSPGVLLQPLGHLSSRQQPLCIPASSESTWVTTGCPLEADLRGPHSQPSTRVIGLGGEGGIRTHVGVAPQPAFEAGPLRPLRYLSVATRRANERLTTDSRPSSLM